MSEWKRIGTPLALKELWVEMFGEGCPVPPPVVWRNGTDLQAMMGREPVGPDKEALEDLRWHISITGPDRVPTWGEMVEAAHSLRPGVVFCVPMPPRHWWINVHPDALHLWQIDDKNLEAQWRSEALGQVPT